MYVWDVLTGTLRYHLEGTSVRFSHAGDILAVVKDDRTIELREGISSALIRSLNNIPPRIWSIAFNFADTLLAVGSDGGLITIWSIATGTQVQTLQCSLPYDDMDISGVMGLTEGQRTALSALGAIQIE